MIGRYFEMYGIPCGQCELPAHHIEVYPNGVRTAHMDQRKRPCDSVRSAASNQPDRRGSEPRPPQVLPRPRAGLAPAMSDRRSA